MALIDKWDPMFILHSRLLFLTTFEWNSIVMVNTFHDCDWIVTSLFDFQSSPLHTSSSRIFGLSNFVVQSCVSSANAKHWFWSFSWVDSILSKVMDILWRSLAWYLMNLKHCHEHNRVDEAAEDLETTTKACCKLIYFLVASIFASGLLNV